MQQRTATALGVDGAVLVGSLAARLAEAPSDGPFPLDTAPLGTALGLLVRGLQLRSAVLRTQGPEGTSPSAGTLVASSGALLAVAGEVVHAVPPMSGQHRHPDLGPSVELPVRAAGREVATLTVVGARPSQLPTLRAAAAVIGLALSVAPGPLVMSLLDAAEDEAAALADTLHDGPAQALLAARYAVDAVVRGADPAFARDAVQVAVVGLRRALWHLRPRGSEDLPGALADLASRSAEQPGTEPGTEPDLQVDLQVDASLAGCLAPQAAAAAYRLVQALLPGADGGSARVRLYRDGLTGVLLVTGCGALPRAASWSARACALGGRLTVSAQEVRLVLPAGSPAALAPRFPRPSGTKANP